MKIYPVPRTIRALPGEVPSTTVLSERINCALGREEYHLRLATDGIVLEAGSDAGLFYGRNTLAKIRRQSSNGFFPAMEIEDAPDFELRGVLFSDITQERTLNEIVPRLALGGINQLQICIRENFPLSRHSKVCCQAPAAWTAEHIRRMDALCKSHFIELVPSINSFGHFESFLKLPEYRHLARYPEGGFVFPWGDRAEYGTMLSGDDASFAFMTNIFDEILPHFSSKTVNIGCDETWEFDDDYDLYCSFVNRLAAFLKARGYRVQIWADILLRHPQSISKLDPAIIPLVWGYNDKYPFLQNLHCFTLQNRQVTACPGTSAFLSICGRSRIALDNINDAARAARDCGALGILNTDWQYRLRALCTAFLPWAHGANAAWNVEAALNCTPAEEANELFFDGKYPDLCQLIFRFGQLSDILGRKIVVDDRSTLFCLYEGRFTPESLRVYGVNEEKMERYFAEVEALREAFGSVLCPSEETRSELLHAVDLAELGGFFALQLLGRRQIPKYELLKEKVLGDETSLWDLHHVPSAIHHGMEQLHRMIQRYDHV